MDWHEHAPTIVSILICIIGILIMLTRNLLMGDVKRILSEIQDMKVNQTRANLMLHKMCLELELSECDDFIRKQEGC